MQLPDKVTVLEVQNILLQTIKNKWKRPWKAQASDELVTEGPPGSDRPRYFSIKWKYKRCIIIFFFVHSLLCEHTKARRSYKWVAWMLYKALNKWMCIYLVDSGQSTATVRPGRSVCGRAWNQEALVLKEEVPPGPAQAVSVTSLFLASCCDVVTSCHYVRAPQLSHRLMPLRCILSRSHQESDIEQQQITTANLIRRWTVPVCVSVAVSVCQSNGRDDGGVREGRHRGLLLIRVLRLRSAGSAGRAVAGQRDPARAGTSTEKLMKGVKETKVFSRLWR